MPRGKYPRQSAAVKAAIAKSEPVIAPLPTAGAFTVEADGSAEFVGSVAPAALTKTVTQAASVAEEAISNARRPHRFADHAKSRDIDTLGETALRAYGLEIGMSRRDCAELAVERLRAGCKAHLARHFDELTE